MSHSSPSKSPTPKAISPPQVFPRRMATLPAVLSVVLILAGAAAAAVGPSSNFIVSSCKATTYPDVCVRSLSSYASTIKTSQGQLAQAALTVSLTRSESTREYLNKLKRIKGLRPREYAAINDCLQEVSDSLDRISNSIQELKALGRAKGQDFIWHMSNVQTWVSSALTDENTCMDGFAGRAMEGRIKTSVRAHIMEVAHVTSNALALVNKFAEKH